MADIPPPPDGFTLAGQLPNGVPPPPAGFQVADSGDDDAVAKVKAAAADQAVAAEQAQARKIGETLRDPSVPDIGMEGTPLLGAAPRDVVAQGNDIRNYTRGNFLGSYLDELLAGISAGANKLTGGAVGAPYDQAVELQRARNRAADAESPDNPEIADLPLVGSVKLSSLSKLLGGTTTGVPLASKLMQGGGILSKAARGSGLGGALAYLYGTGEGEGSLANRNEAGLEALPWGLALGGALPPALEGGTYVGGKVRNLAAPWMARARASFGNLPDTISDYFSPSAPVRSLSAAAPGEGAPPSAPEDSAGAQAHFEQMLADRMYQAGEDPDEVLRQITQEGEQASLYNGGGPRGTSGASYAPNVLAIPDVSTGAQKQAGSAVRASAGAAKYGSTFQGVRQSGVTPSGGVPEEMGLPSRPLLAPIDPNAPAMGQAERLSEAHTRAQLLWDEEHHGHGSTALQTEEQLLAEQRATADKNYAETRSAANGEGEGQQPVNFAPTIGPILNKWETDAKMMTKPVRNAVNSAIDLFRDDAGNPLTTFDQVDQAKRFLDDTINGHLNAQAPQTTIGRKLQGFKKELFQGTKAPEETPAPAAGNEETPAAPGRLPGIDEIEQNGVGKLYKGSRDAYSDDAKMLEALRLGKEAPNEESEVSANTYNALESNGEKKLFRKGLTGTIDATLARRRLSSDATLMFQTKRMQDLLRAVIPADRTPTGRIPMRGGVPTTFSDRPQRFGKYFQNEMRMVESGKKIFGGSDTAVKLADDETYHALENVSDAIKETTAAAKGGGDWQVRIWDWATRNFIKVFGMQQDVAMATARGLFTTDKARIAQTLANVKMRMGNNRYEKFRKMIADNHAAIIRQMTRPNDEESNDSGTP